MIEKDIFSDLTILVTAYNRYSYLKRLCKFIADFNLPWHIKILDSSNVIRKSEIEPVLKLMKSYEYKVFDSDTLVAKKIAYGHNNIETKYVTLWADDDFIIPSAIATAIKFLDENNDYTFAHGLYLTFFDLFGKICYTPAYQNSIDFIHPDPLVRLRAHLGQYEVATTYAIHRTDASKIMWDITQKHTSDWDLHEVLPSAISLVLGKGYYFNEIYGLRLCNQKHTFTKEDLKRMHSVKKIEKAALGLAIIISKELRMEIQEANKIAHDAILSFSNPVLQGLNVFGVRESLKRFIDKFGLLIYLRYLKNQYVMYKRSLENKEDDGAIKNFLHKESQVRHLIEETIYSTYIDYKEIDSTRSSYSNQNK